MKKSVILLILLLTGINAISQVTITSNLDGSIEMSQNLFGAFFEDINYGADGGLYAELIQNRSFEYYAVPGYTSEGPLAHWSLAHSENRFSYYSVTNTSPLNANNTNYLKLIVSDMDTLSEEERFPLKGKIGVGSWATQVKFDSVMVVSGDHVWLDENFNDALNWDVRGGSFTITDGTYVQSSTSTPAWSIAGTEIDTSVYTYTVKAMKTGGNEGFLIPFAYSDDNNYYWLNIGGWGNTLHAIEKCTSGTKNTVVSASGSISSNVWYTIKIEVTSSVCKFYMNDALLFEMETPSPDNKTIVLDEPGYAGVVNTGYFGMAVENGKNYKFSTYLKCDAGYSGIVKVSLHDGDGNIIASDTIESITTTWQKYYLELTPNDSSTEAYLSLLFNQTGVIYADMISLFPEETFKNRENGLRKDLAQTIADLNPSFLRFPGGCIVHGRGLDNAYRWKETVGDVAERTPNWNLWNYHQTYGLGFYEFFLFCEDIGAKPLPVLPVGISCQFRDREIEPIANMGPWIQDAVDLVEFANGDTLTEWGSVRAEMGHPEPFNLEYLCLGNEEDDIPQFRERFIMFQDTMAKYCPEIKIIGTSGTDDAGSYYVSLWQFSRERKVFAVDEHYYNSPAWFLANNHRYDAFDRNGPKVFIGEYASQDDKLYNAICEAAYLTGVERNADVIEFTCYAPLLNYQEDIYFHWHPDLILFDNTSVVKTANYYVQQMYGQNTGDEYFNNNITYDESFEFSTAYGPVTASLVRDNNAKVYVLKLINSSNTALDATINFYSTEPFSTTADLTVLTGASGARNSMDNPNVIAPVNSTISISDHFIYQMPAYSFSLMRFSSNEVVVSVSEKFLDKNNNDKEPLIYITPNPAVDYFNIRFNDEGKLHTVSLLNLQGQVQKTIENIKEDHLTIDRGSLPPGTYIISVLSENSTTTGIVILIQ
jgi:alpha-L-arabinofuranosidase